MHHTTVIVVLPNNQLKALPKLLAMDVVSDFSTLSK